MDGFVITLIVIGSLLTAYVLLFIVNLVFVNLFLKRLKVHNNALTIILNQKYDNLIELYQIYKKHNIDLSNVNKELFNIDINVFKIIDSKECLNARQLLSTVKQELTSIYKRNDKLTKNEQIIFLLKILNEIDEQFRAISASYNSDIIGYNYWIRFKPYMYIFLFNRVEKKDTI